MGFFKRERVEVPASVVRRKRQVVARYPSGRMVKGTTINFLPNKPKINIFEGGDESKPAVSVNVASLKAIFFVKSYQGDPFHKEDAQMLKQAQGTGRKIQVVFRDGEAMQGYTLGYSATAAGFFIFPLDPRSNNSRVFVVNRAVDEVRWLER